MLYSRLRGSLALAQAMSTNVASSVNSNIMGMIRKIGSLCYVCVILVRAKTAGESERTCTISQSTTIVFVGDGSGRRSACLCEYGEATLRSCQLTNSLTILFISTSERTRCWKNNTKGSQQDGGFLTRFVVSSTPPRDTRMREEWLQENQEESIRRRV